MCETRDNKSFLRDIKILPAIMNAKLVAINELRFKI